MRNRAKYSSAFQVREEYLFVPPLISNAAARNQDQCKNKSIPPTRNSRNEPGRMLVMRENYNIIIGCLADKEGEGDRELSRGWDFFCCWRGGGVETARRLDRRNPCG